MMKPISHRLPPRARVIIDNDFAGDPDNLFQLAHHLLSPSVEVAFISVSGIPVDAERNDLNAVERGMSVARALLDTIKSSARIVPGSGVALTDVRTPHPSASAQAIVTEAMREDTDLPLYVALGGGLTELASAYLLEPRIAERLTAVWIGGPEYPDSRYHVEDILPIEYNLSTDVRAGQVVFGSPIPLWQVPNDAYRQCLVSWAELDARVDVTTDLGALLLRSLEEVLEHMIRAGVNLGETYILGDNPLVALTALQGTFWNEPCSSSSRLRARQAITDEGSYGRINPDLPGVRVFDQIDTRSMFEDMFAKFARHGGGVPASITR